MTARRCGALSFARVCQCVFLLTAGFVVACTAASSAGAPGGPPLLLISLDGFRWDYCALHPKETPRLRALASTGVSAQSLVPVYPSNTFPNHYAIVTGLYPAHSGIINNDFFDPASGEYFRYNRAESVGQSKWWWGEPVWVTAERQGVRAASYFWVGSEAAIGGVRPTYWKRYDYSIPFERRLDDVAAWLRRPVAERPGLITFYLEETNSAGHDFGPDSPEIAAAIQLLDGRVGQLVDRVTQVGPAPNVIVVSDHGMSRLVDNGTMILEDYVDMRDVQVDFESPEVGLHPLKGTPVELVERLKGLPHAHAMLSGDLPKRFLLQDNPRIPPVWVMVDPGWHLETRAKFKTRTKKPMKGDHGYDPLVPDMHGILIANGPAFLSNGRVLPAVENVDIYNLMCAVLGIHPSPNDGDERLVRTMLRAP